jgi:predicted GNAT superfamily acetyltransferase
MGAEDAAGVLALNHAWQHFTSPLDAQSLERLRGAAAPALVAGSRGAIIACVLALPEGLDYASPNYRWFCDHYARFLYVDRVVVAADQQRRGIGAGLYGEIMAAARRQSVPLVVCELDADNHSSAAFHDRLGFAEVARERLGDGHKLVSLRVRQVAPAAAPADT